MPASKSSNDDQTVPALIVNARMYAVTPAVRDRWRALFDWISRRTGVALTYIDHAAPAPLEELWSRGDLAAAFMCGYPYAMAAQRPQLVAAPIPSPPRYGRRPVYCTDFIVRADGSIERLSDAFGGRIGWTVEHSQSGFNAVRHHLLGYRRAERLFSASVGPLVTPRRVIAAVLQGEIDVGPLDSYVHDLLRLHEPETAARLRVVESTAMTPIPPLIAAPEMAPDTVEQLGDAFLETAVRSEAAAILESLLLAGFARVDAADYMGCLDQARAAVAAGLTVPA
jgi:ABC-type phosphate/phosphonate transport system substrate-binding protein